MQSPPTGVTWIKVEPPSFDLAGVLLAVAIHFQDLAVTTRAVLVIAFFFLTAPVGAHMIARAAYAVGVPLWEGTITDELRDRRRVAQQAAPDSPAESPMPPAEESDTP